MRGDIVVQSQLMIAQAIGQLAKQIEDSTGIALTPVVFASLPAGALGQIACISDSTVTSGAVTVGGGANKVLAWHNGTNWTVIGI